MIENVELPGMGLETAQQKTCARCQLAVDRSEFRASKHRRYGLAAYCRPCESEYQKEYRARNVERLKQYREDTYDAEKKFASDIKSRYGITTEQYAALLEAQGGACAICRESCATGNRLAVDHDHDCCPGKKSCGKCVRGLLCTRCNPGIGYFRDDIELLRRAVAYLERKKK